MIDVDQYIMLLESLSMHLSSLTLDLFLSYREEELILWKRDILRVSLSSSVKKRYLRWRYRFFLGKI
jgi:hypothetical protein